MAQPGLWSVRGAPREARRRALLVAVWLALVLLLGGIDLPERGFGFLRYQWFGIVSVFLGLLYVYALADRGVIRDLRGWFGGLLVAYWIAGTATVFGILLPPHGIAHVVFAIVAASLAGVIISCPNRGRATVWLAGLVGWLAVVRFGLVPLFRARGQGAESVFPWLSELSPALRGLSAVFPGDRPAALFLDVVALACWGAALLVQRGPVDALRAPSER